MQAHHIMAHGVASAFTTSTILAACTLLIALFAIRARAGASRSS